MLDIATADMAFEAFGGSLGELFENCGRALTAVMTDPAEVEPKEKEEFSVGGHDLQSLLFDYLSELIYLKDTKGLIFSEFKVRINEDDFSLSCVARGEVLDRRKHELKTEVKAVTYHQMVVEELADKKTWRAQVVLDT
jgi:SHS2 domain-containing protein